MIVFELMSMLISGVGQLLLFFLIMNVSAGAVMGAIVLHGWLMRLIDSQ